MTNEEIVTGGVTLNHKEEIKPSTYECVIDILQERINKLKNKTYWLYSIIGAEAVYIILSSIFKL